MILPVLFAQPISSDSKEDNIALDNEMLQDNIPPDLQNVSLDDAKLEEALPKGLQKVDLDLDDALFLEFEEDEPAHEPPPPEPVSEPAPLPPEDAPKPEQRFWHDKRVLAGGSMFTLLVLAGLVYLALRVFSVPEKPKDAVPEATAPAAEPVPPQFETTAPSVMTGTDSTTSPVYHMNLDPFYIEFKQNGQTHFLMCRVYLTGMTKAMQNDLQKRETEVRDMVYSYFKSLDFSVVEQGPTAEALTQGLQAAINAHIQPEHIGGVVLDEFVVR